MFSYIIQWFIHRNDVKLQCGMCGENFYVYANRRTDMIYYCSYQCCLRKFSEEHSKSV